MYLAGQNAIRPDSPMFGAAILLEQLDPLSAPRVIRRNAETLPDDAVYLRPQQKLVHRELLGGAEGCCSLIANLENGGPRYRLLVILDLVFYVQLVLVLERPRTVLRHGVRQGWTGV